MNNSALQVFAGGWAQLIHEKFKNMTNLTMGTPVSVNWKIDDGLKVFVSDGGSDTLKEFTTVIPWDIAGLLTGAQSPIWTAVEQNVRAFDIADDGSRAWMTGLTTSGRIFQMDMSTNWNVTTLDVVSPPSFFPTESTGLISGLKVINRGKKLFTLINDSVFEYNLSTPNDITTGVTFVTSEPIFPQSTDMTEIEFSTDGQFMYALSRSGYRVFRYRLNTRNTFADGIDLLDFVSLDGTQTSAFGLFIKPTDGKILYAVGFSPDEIECFDMSLTENESLINELGDTLVNESGEPLVA